MASIAVLLYADRLGIAHIKKEGTKPGFSGIQWEDVEDVQALLAEPVLLVSAIRSMLGDENKYNVYLNVWPGAYNSVMFSHAKTRGADVKRLRQSELETVFRGEHDNMYTYDLMLDQGRTTYSDKRRRLIYVMPKNTITLLNSAFAADKMSLRRIAPLDACAAEAALKLWSPAKDKISACVFIDDATTNVAFYSRGAIQSIRTVPEGMGDILAEFVRISGLKKDLCRQLILNNTEYINDEKFGYRMLLDKVVTFCNKLVADIVKSLHTIFGESASLDQVLLCGSFAKTAGLADYIADTLKVQCEIVSADTLSTAIVSSVVQESQNIEEVFPFALCSTKGVDLLQAYKKEKSDKQTSIVASVLVVLAAGAVMLLAPQMKKTAEEEKLAAISLLSDPVYVAVQELIDERYAANGKTAQLQAAIEGMPHGVTDCAGLISDLYDMTSDYGSVTSLTIDYTQKSIKLSFTTTTYDRFVGWQNELTENGRFSFVTMPSFNGSGVTFTAEAIITATDFEEQLAENMAENGNDVEGEESNLEQEEK